MLLEDTSKVFHLKYLDTLRWMQIYDIESQNHTTGQRLQPPVSNGFPIGIYFYNFWKESFKQKIIVVLKVWVIVRPVKDSAYKLKIFFPWGAGNVGLNKSY